MVDFFLTVQFDLSLILTFPVDVFFVDLFVFCFKIKDSGLTI